MKQGKQTCRILKEIRRRIAEANDIEYVVSECQYKGDCTGTCPRCESELLYLEQQLEKRCWAGKTVTLLGISVGFAAFTGLSSCKNQSEARNDVDNTSIEEMPMGEVVYVGNKHEKETDTIKFDERKAIVKVPAAKEKLRMNVAPVSKIEDVEMIKDTVLQEDCLTGAVETMPLFPGGEGELMKFLRENTQYPDSLRLAGIQGRVVVRFVVDEKGNIKDAKILRSVHPELDKEALRVINIMPRWIPGKMLDKPSPFYFTIPVVFRTPSY